MHKLMIYLQSDSHYLQKTDRGYGCLVVKPDGSRWKAAGHGETTWHQAELIVLRGALTRLDDNYEVHIFSEDTFVLGNFTNGNVEHWREKGFRRNDGKEIANAYLWREISQKTGIWKEVEWGLTLRCVSPLFYFCEDISSAERVPQRII